MAVLIWTTKSNKALSSLAEGRFAIYWGAQTTLYIEQRLLVAVKPCAQECSKHDLFLRNFLFLFFRVCECTRLHTCVLHHSSTLFIKSGSLTEKAQQPVYSGDLPPLPSETGITGRPRSPPVIYMGAEDPHTCVVDALITEPPPQPLTEP